MTKHDGEKLYDFEYSDNEYKNFIVPYTDEVKIEIEEFKNHQIIETELIGNIVYVVAREYRRGYTKAMEKYNNLFDWLNDNFPDALEDYLCEGDKQSQSNELPR